MRLGDCRGIVETVNEACTCGGAGQGEGCPACEVYHGIKDMDDGSDELDHWKRKARKLGEYAAAQRKVCKAYAYATLGGTMRQHAIDGHVRRSIKSAMRKP